GSGRSFGGCLAGRRRRRRRARRTWRRDAGGLGQADGRAVEVGRLAGGPDRDEPVGGVGRASAAPLAGGRGRSGGGRRRLVVGLGRSGRGGRQRFGAGRRRGRRRRRLLGDRRLLRDGGLGLLGRLLGRLRRCRLLGLDVATESLRIRLAADAVGLGVLDARRVALDADLQRLAEVECLLVGEPEL